MRLSQRIRVRLWRVGRKKIDGDGGDPIYGRALRTVARWRP